MKNLAGSASSLRAACLLGLAALPVTASAWSTTTAKDADAPMDTPVGITIQQLPLDRKARREGAEAVKVYADSRGMTLYTSKADENGKSKCQGECSKLWMPARAIGKPPSADWSVIRRADGTRQWALLGRPLYTYAKESKIGETAGATSANPDWKPAVYVVARVQTPPGIAVHEVPELFGQALVNKEGHTLYLFEGDNPEKDYSACGPAKGDCAVHWTPLAAPEVAAQRIGDFAVLRRPDGTAQWTYHGHGLYTYDGDVAGELAEGENKEPMFRPALVRRTFLPPEIRVQRPPGVSRVLSTAQGMTLYRRLPGTYNSAHYFTFGGRRYVPAYGYALGLKGCDSICEKDWTPVKASAGSQSTGYWYLVKRDDGSSVWAYRGFVLYTYSQDKAPGDYVGDGLYQVVVSEDPKVAASLPADPNLNGDGDSSVLSWMRAQTF